MTKGRRPLYPHVPKSQKGQLIRPSLPTSKAYLRRMRTDARFVKNQLLALNIASEVIDKDLGTIEIYLEVDPSTSRRFIDRYLLANIETGIKAAESLQYLLSRMREDANEVLVREKEHV